MVSGGSIALVVLGPDRARRPAISSYCRSSGAAVEGVHPCAGEAERATEFVHSYGAHFLVAPGCDLAVGKIRLPIMDFGRRHGVSARYRGRCARIHVGPEVVGAVEAV